MALHMSIGRFFFISSSLSMHITVCILTLLSMDSCFFLVIVNKVCSVWANALIYLGCVAEGESVGLLIKSVTCDCVCIFKMYCYIRTRNA